MPSAMAGSGVLSSCDTLLPSKLPDPKVLPLPFPSVPPPFDLPSLLPIPSLPHVKVLPRKKFLRLFETLPRGSILFPGCKAYEQAIFIGNLLYRFVTPSAVVQAVTVEDVMATVSFAKENKIKLTVKSGGHSMGGYCLNDNGIVLDISTMNDVKIDQANMIATIQGGAVWHDAYRLLKETNVQLVTLGGNCPSVGVSAFLLGGGLSPFSRKYGLGVDSLLEMTIVTADGEKVTVTGDKKEDPKKHELFWAVRGGGGGNFGITVGVKIKLHNLVDKRGIIVGGNLTWKLDQGSQQEKDFKSMMEVWNTTDWPVEVRGDALWHYENNQLLGKMTMVYNGNWDACIEAIWPLLKFNPEIDLRPMHWTDWEVIDGKVDVFEKIYHHHASFIFGKGGITAEVTKIIMDLMSDEIITKNNDVDCYILWHHIGGATTKIKPRDTAFFWRDGFYVFHVKVLWANSDLNDQMFNFFDYCKRQLVRHSIQGKAAYLNYIDPTVKNWGEVYYGDNYQKLCRIKTDWDPTGFFTFPQGLPRLIGNNFSQPPCPEPDWESWSKYALPTPQLLGNPKTRDEAYSIDAGIRRSMSSIQLE